MFSRCDKNPVVSPDDVTPSADGFKVVGSFNPGATIYNDEIILLIRLAESCVAREGKVCVPVFSFDKGESRAEVLEFDANDPEVALKDTRGVVYKGKEYLSSISHIRLARSKDGIDFTVDDKPFLVPTEERETYGIEDARAMCIDNMWYLNYTIVSTDSWATALAKTEDFNHIEKLGIIFHPENKDVAIFPEKINGYYYALHRPNNSGFGKASIWCAKSPDLLHWGDHRCLVRPRATTYESMKIGGGSAPIKTDEGWLTIYHAKGDNQRYTLFGLLLDLEEPWKIVKQGTMPLLEPKAEYETTGFFPNVVFTNGCVVKGDTLYMYYGASDQYCCLATAKVDDLLHSL